MNVSSWTAPLKRGYRLCHLSALQQRYVRTAPTGKDTKRTEQWRWSISRTLSSGYAPGFTTFWSGLTLIQSSALKSSRRERNRSGKQKDAVWLCAAALYTMLICCCWLLQAFSHVSRLLSQCQFEALEGLVAKDVSIGAEQCTAGETRWGRTFCSYSEFRKYSDTSRLC